ncbi:Alpha/Beta hydrolase protein [Flagelloscypha sp. PMI_526]|nr:Alpha/Beta hydrolase protein [Flagelloscypha sp. PMI_526]
MSSFSRLLTLLLPVMSDLYRSALSARIAKLPTDLPHMDGIEDDEEGEENDSLGTLPGTGMGPPAMPRRTHLLNPKKKAPNPAFSPISASTYFTTANQVSVPSRSLDVRVYYTPPAFADGTVFVCHHGAGYSGLSFACFAKEVQDLAKGECGVLAVDARRHGKTTAIGGASDEDLSIQVLVDDLVEVLGVTFPDPSAAPAIILIGHSMGGSVVTRACPLLQEKKYHVGGVAVLEAVEGFAIEALPHMNNLLNARPDGFDSVEEAIQWHVKTKTIRNPTSARIAVPGIFIPNPNPDSTPPFVWRTPLRSTAPYWEGWFKSLSPLFLNLRAARLLVLAGTERLDRDLMIGQMQGKFQLVVVPDSGHMVQEDEPTKCAEVLVGFWKRNEKLDLKGVKKVGEA